MTKYKACAHPGCPARHTEKGRFCKQHKKVIPDGRPSAAARGYDARWEREKTAFLRDHPWCECDECKASDKPLRANTVDHIIPHRGDPGLFWDISNWQAMYKPHHDRKTATQDGGFGR